MDQDHNRILAALAAEMAADRDDPTASRLMAVLNAPDELVYRSVREGMAGLLYLHLKKTGTLGLVGDKLGRRLAQTYYHAVQHHLRLETELASVLDRLAAERIPTVFLQGITLQQDVYTTSGQRPLYDIDVWVLPENFNAFRQLMRDCGYNQDAFYPHTFRKDAVVFDVHTHLFWADRIKARRHLLAVDQGQVFRDAEGFSVAGRPAMRLNRYDQVFYLSLHALKHNAERLIWLVDIQLLLAKMTSRDWHLLIERADVLGQTRSLAQILFLLDELLWISLPYVARKFRQVQRLTIVEKWLLRRRKKSGRLPRWSTILLYPAGMRRGRWHLIWETFFPKPDVLKQSFPESVSRPIGCLYLKRFLQIVATLLKKNPAVPAAGRLGS
jgi:hypothetical protein